MNPSLRSSVLLVSVNVRCRGAKAALSVMVTCAMGWNPAQALMTGVVPCPPTPGLSTHQS